jgi:hypothetical protein
VTARDSDTGGGHPDLAELEAVGGSLGSVLMGPTLARAVLGLVAGLALGWLVFLMRQRLVARSPTSQAVRPRPRPSGLPA